MKQKTERKLLGVLLTLALALGLVLGMSMTAKADGYVAKVGETSYSSFAEALNAWGLELRLHCLIM